jgi:hypothetical protein
VALTGRLSELSPPELFQLLSLTRKTGRVTLTFDDRQGVVILRQGKIVFAASDTLRSAFCSTLAQGLVMADSRLVEEVGRRLPGSVTDSGTFLVEYREADPGALVDAVRGQIEATVRELVQWREGEFRFDPLDLPESGEVTLGAGWFALEAGLDSEALLLRALARLDEGQRATWEQDLADAASEVAPPVESAERSDISAAFEVLVDESTGEISWIPVGPGTPPRDHNLSGLRHLMEEARSEPGMSPELTAEVALLILRYAAQVVNRGVLFAVRGDIIRGIGQFGLRFADADSRVRQLAIPVGESSLFSPVLETGRVLAGRVPENPWTAYVLERVGASASTEVAVIPLIVDGVTVAVLYVDNLPCPSRVEAVDGLEILMFEVGLGVEQARLQAGREKS